MHFTSEELDRIRSRIEEYWPAPRTCSVCQRDSVQWRVSPAPILLPVLIGNADISARNVGRIEEHIAFAPSVALTCSECGHIIFFNAAQMNLVPLKTPLESRYFIPSR